MMRGMKHYARILLIAGIIIAVAAAAWYLGHNQKASDQVPADEMAGSSVAPLASVTPLALSYDAAPDDWTTYASAGFSVKYPADWTVGPCAPGCTGWAPTASAQFVFGIIESDGKLDEILTSAQPYLAAKEDVTAGANTWTKLTLQQPTTGDVVTSHFIEHGGKLYEFGTATNDPDELLTELLIDSAIEFSVTGGAAINVAGGVAVAVIPNGGFTMQ